MILFISAVSFLGKHEKINVKYRKYGQKCEYQY